MAIEFNCPHCGKRLKTSDERAGARALCPACNQLIAVPASAGSTVAAGVPVTGLPETVRWSSPSASARFEAPAASGSVPSGAVSSPGISGGSDPDAGARSNRGPTEFCPNCRTAIEPGASYCSKCGLPLLEPPPLRYAAFWRRVVAVLIDAAIIAAVAEALWHVLPGRSWVIDNVAFVVWFFYHAGLESSPEQATVGKRLMGIIVCGVDGRRLTFPRAAIRTLAKILSGLICGVGYIMPLLTLRKQALHDVLTDAVVVQK